MVRNRISWDSGPPIGIPEILISYWFLLMILHPGFGVATELFRLGSGEIPDFQEIQFGQGIAAPNRLLEERDGGGIACACFPIGGPPRTPGFLP